MTVSITRGGMLSTIQDSGRRNAGVYGVTPAGFADPLSAIVANRLVGNDDGAAVIEATMTGIGFRASEDVWVAVTGANATLTVNGQPAPSWQTIFLHAGDVLELGTATSGVRSYIAFSGGIDVPLVLGSASTDLTANFGGLEGRGLRSGDELGLIPHEDRRQIRHLPHKHWPHWREPATLRVVAGPHYQRLSSALALALLEQTYRVSPQCNRQGVRLDGAALESAGGWDAVSFGVCAGCVQLTSSGLPIILLADHQTTGGYQVPIVIVSADIPIAAQLKPGDQVRFAAVSHAESARITGAALQALSRIEMLPSHDQQATA